MRAILAVRALIHPALSPAVVAAPLPVPASLNSILPMMEAGGSRHGQVRSWPALVGPVVTGAGYYAALAAGWVPAWPVLVALAVLTWPLAVLGLGGAGLRARLRPTPRLVVMGLAAGVLLYGLLRLAALVTRQTPLWEQVMAVADLAGQAPPLLAALAVLGLIAPAEEVLWRGVVFAAAERWTGRGWGAVAVSTLAYAAAVGGSGNPVLPLAAAGCGLVWARQRQVTGSLVPALVGHALWSALAVAYVR